MLRACRNPLVLLLAALGTVSLITGDVRAATVITAMIVLGVTRLYWPILAATALAYMALMQLVKVMLLRRRWI